MATTLEVESESGVVQRRLSDLLVTDGRDALPAVATIQVPPAAPRTVTSP